jgi:hypothetical protein
MLGCKCALPGWRWRAVAWRWRWAAPLTANLNRCLQLQQVWLAHEDFLGCQAQLPDLQQQQQQ